MTIIIFLIILGILVLVHEFGHFISAKKSGIRVDEFGIGFPPTLFSWKPKKSETKYSLNIVPFGGFVKIFGENPDEESISGPDSNRSFVNKPRYIQVWVLSAGVIFNVLFAWFLITFGFAYGFPMPIDETNEQYAENTNLTILSVLPDSPAENAGLKSGDVISEMTFENLTINNPNGDEVQNLISNSNGNEINIGYTRGREVGDATLIAEGGIVEGNLAVGISMDEVGIVKFPFVRALIEGSKLTVNLLGLITVGLAGFIVDAFSGGADLSQVSGPVGIVGLVGDASALGFIYLISFTALISLHLAVINLIPFPALDGGRILFVIIEGIIRKPINPKFQNWANGIGFVLLILLMIVITYNDIIKLF